MAKVVDNLVRNGRRWKYRAIAKKHYEWGGHIAVVGLLDGFEAKIDVLSLIHQQATIRGMEVGSKRDFEAMNQAIANQDIHPVIDRIFPFEQTKEAFEYLERGLHFGKVVITL